MQRQQGESFESYKVRRALDNIATRQKMRGQYFFVSRTAPFLAKDTPGARNGDLVSYRRTYRKPKEAPNAS
jgi:hypothetical protein